LVLPRARNLFQDLLDGQGARLTTFDDSLDDVGCKTAEPQQAAEMGIVELCDMPDVDPKRVAEAMARPPRAQVAALPALELAVRTENSIRVDSVEELPIVSDDGCAVILSWPGPHR
jgi:hypothetical protein